jgi:hypothetical protein
MKAKDIKCKICGGEGKLFGQDQFDMEGPFGVACNKCGIETNIWAYPREAWKNWKLYNLKKPEDADEKKG